MYLITVYGIPKAQPRPKAFRTKTHVSVYNPKTADDWKDAVKAAVIQQEPGIVGTKKEGPVELSIRFNMPRSKSMNQKGWKQDTRKPDVDNLIKAVMDSLTNIEVWKDDSQVTILRAEKWICTQGHEPGAIIGITWI